MKINLEKLAVALVQNEMKCGELAELSGVSRSTISAIRSGKRCSKVTAEKLAAVLGEEIYA